MKQRSLGKAFDSTEGSAVAAVLMVMAVLSILGVCSVGTAVTEQQIAANALVKKQAFYNADAGVHLTLACIEKDLAEGREVLPGEAGSAKEYTLPAKPPNGIGFSISPLKMTGETDDLCAYEFTSTGAADSALSGIESRITARFSRKVLKPARYAVYGNEKVEIGKSAIVSSFNSRSSDPACSDPEHENFESTHQADIGSNIHLEAEKDSLVDGACSLGEKDEKPAETRIHEDADIYGETGRQEGRIDPHPLGIDSGGKYDPSEYKTENDNSDVPESLELKAGKSLVLNGKPGGADYYFRDAVLKSGSELEIDASAGPVNIFVDQGGFCAEKGSQVKINGSSLDIAVFSNSGDQPVEFRNNGEFRGFVYAPDTRIVIGNSGNFYGSVWAGKVSVNNSGIFFYNQALKGKYARASDELVLSGWMEEAG